MQIRPTAFTIGLIIHPSIALFCVYTEFGIDSQLIMYYLRGGHPRRFLLCKLSHAKLVHLSVKSECFIRMKCEVYNYVITVGP